jgi:hypothetical protein
MTRDERAFDLLRRHGPRLRLNLECFPPPSLPFHISVWSDEAGEWVTIAESADPADAILAALEIADNTNIYSEAVH